jgi:hypothetical protein
MEKLLIKWYAETISRGLSNNVALLTTTCIQCIFNSSQSVDGVLHINDDITNRTLPRFCCTFVLLPSF